MRNSIQDFSLANPIYAGATVSFYTVSAGVKTTTLATLYSGLTGTTTLTNPQTLDSDGKFQQPVYVDAPVIATVSGLSIADHDTGIVQAVLSASSLNDVYSEFASTAIGKGSALIGFLPSGTGAAAITVQDKLREVVSVKDFGALGDGSNDDTAEIQAAIDYAETLAGSGTNRGAVVYFPPGQYLVTAPLTITTSRVALRGAGSFQSQLVRNADYGNTITVLSQTAGTLNILERVEISGLSLYHDVSGAIAMTDVHVLVAAVTHLRLRDIDINNGAYGISLYGCVDAEIYGCDVIGTNTSGANNATVGIGLYDAASSGYALGSAVSLPTQISITESEVFGPLNTGWNYGLLINAAEDVTVSNTYLGNSKYYNVYIQQTAGDKTILEVSFSSGTYIDGAGFDSVRIDGDAGSGSSYIGSVSFDGCDIKGQSGQTNNGIFVSGTARGGTYAQACRNLRVSGCRIGDYDESGIRIDGCVNAVLSGNMIGGNNYNIATGGRGLLIGAACSRVSINGGRIGGLPEGNGTSAQTYGIELVSGCSEVHIDGVDVSNNTTGGVLDSTGLVTTSQRTVWVTNCRGYNGNRTATGPAIPASTVAQYNPYGAPCWVSIFDGTVSDIKLNGQTINGATGVMFMVGPGDRITMTYTVAPSWIWWPQ